MKNLIPLCEPEHQENLKRFLEGENVPAKFMVYLSNNRLLIKAVEEYLRNDQLGQIITHVLGELGL